MTDKVFVDSNVLIYAHDLDAQNRHEMAVEVIRRLWQTKTAIISTQVLQEFYVNITRKIPQPLSPTLARQVLKNYLCWQVEINYPDTILLASEIHERHRLSFWDAMMVAAAVQGGAQSILTEDLNPGQLIEGIRIVNPFRVP